MQSPSSRLVRQVPRVLDHSRTRPGPPRAGLYAAGETTKVGSHGRQRDAGPAMNRLPESMHVVPAGFLTRSRSSMTADGRLILTNSLTRLAGSQRSAVVIMFLRSGAAPAS